LRVHRDALRYHEAVVTAALERNLHVFCEKPFALDPATGFRLADLAERKGLTNQVGYHYVHRSFQRGETPVGPEADRRTAPHPRRGVRSGGAARQGSTWRSQKSEGGGCLFDYSCHAIDLMNYLVGRPTTVSAR